MIGVGRCGPKLLRILAENPDAELRWICDPDHGRLAKYRRQYPAARATTRLERVLADPRVEAVIIATCVCTHYELAAQVLGAGKHVFVEEPLASSSELADDLAALAHARDRIVVCGHTFVHSPPVRAVKRMLEAGTLGAIYFISSSRMNRGLPRRDVNVIWDLGPRDFSVLLYWLSEMPTSVRAVGRDSIGKGFPDVAFVTLSFTSGIVVNVELTRLAPSTLRRTTLVGSERMVTYDEGAAEPVRLFDQGVVDRDSESFGQHHLPRRSGDILSARVETFEPLGLELADFVNGIRANDRMEVHTTLARSVVRIVEAADRSLVAGGDEVAVDHAGLAPRRALRPELALV